jgi:hypothetical protein
VSCVCRCFWSRLWRRMPGSRNVVPVIQSDFVSFTNEWNIGIELTIAN